MKDSSKKKAKLRNLQAQLLTSTFPTHATILPNRSKVTSVEDEFVSSSDFRQLHWWMDAYAYLKYQNQIECEKVYADLQQRTRVIFHLFSHRYWRICVCVRMRTAKVVCISDDGHRTSSPGEKNGRRLINASGNTLTTIINTMMAIAISQCRLALMFAS